MSFNVSETPEWVLQYRNIWNGVESQLFEKLTTEPIKGEGKYMHGKLKTWKELLRRIFMVKMFHTTFIGMQRHC